MKKYNIQPYDPNTDQDDYLKEEIYQRAKKRLEKLKGFYWHLAVYLIINIFLILLIGIRSEGFWQFGTFTTPIFWGIGLLLHGFSVFGPNLFFGKEWESRKIKEFMEKDKQGWE